MSDRASAPIPLLSILLACAGGTPAGSGGVTLGEVSISAIQGRSHYSPLAGQVVRASGTVTAVAGRTVYVQEWPGDGDPATSDAVLLAAPPAPAVGPGDRIAFRGRVTEAVPGGTRTANLSVTTVEAESLTVLGRGTPLPAPVVLGPGGRWPPAPEIIGEDELPVDLRDSAEARANRFDPAGDAIDFFEALEGMRVRVPAPVAVSAVETHGPGSSEMWTLPDRGRGVADSRRSAAGGILLRSGPANRGPQNTERVQIQFDSSLWRRSVPPVAVGDRLGDVVGVMRYDFGNYEVAATEPLDVHARRRPDAERTTLRGAGDYVTVASYNVLNLSAGEEDREQRALLGRQIARNLGAPDLLALQEIQDDSGERDDGTVEATETMRALVAAIAAAGGPAYAFADVPPRDGRPGGAPGGNIRNAFLYRTGRVALERHGALTAARLREAGVTDTAVFAESRDPLLGVFRVGERRLTVINNHLTSRYGSTPAFGAVQPFVQAGTAERAGQAAALHRYVSHLLADSPADPIVVLGDMNTFEFTDELARILPGDPPVLFPLAPLVSDADRYTYIFQGNSQALDHVFVTAALRPGAGLDVVHLNVDFPAVGNAPASDHEPIVARVFLGEGPPP